MRTLRKFVSCWLLVSLSENTDKSLVVSLFFAVEIHLTIYYYVYLPLQFILQSAYRSEIAVSSSFSRIITPIFNQPVIVSLPWLQPLEKYVTPLPLVLVWKSFCRIPTLPASLQLLETKNSIIESLSVGWNREISDCKSEACQINEFNRLSLVKIRRETRSMTVKTHGRTLPFQEWKRCSTLSHRETIVSAPWMAATFSNPEENQNHEDKVMVKDKGKDKNRYGNRTRTRSRTKTRTKTRRRKRGKNKNMVWDKGQGIRGKR